MKSWSHVTAVRVPLHEACWNAEPYANPAPAGTSYGHAVKACVSLLNADGLVVILDLHWTGGLYTGNSSGCSSAQATCFRLADQLARHREHRVPGLDPGRLGQCPNVLITGYAGDPIPFGAACKAILQSLP